MRKNYFSDRLKDSREQATMTLINENGQQRVRRLSSVTKLKEDGVTRMRLVRFLSPPDVRGTSTLMIEHRDRDDDMWVYLPALGKVRRLVSRNKGDSYVGTDFTYGDILGHKVEDYTHRIIGSETVDGAECFVVESDPVSEAVRRDSGYGRRVSWVRKDNFATARLESYDLKGRLFKRYTATDIRSTDPALDRWQAMRMEIVNVQTAHRTVLAYEEFRANIGVEPSFFTTRYLDKEF